MEVTMNWMRKDIPEWVGLATAYIIMMEIATVMALYLPMRWNI